MEMEIVVLCGGDSAERRVSLCSGERVAEALRQSGHAAVLLDMRVEPSPAQMAQMRRADAVFLTLHGGAGEDGRLQSSLEQAGIFHYTGSGPAASALAMHKALAKDCVSRAGVPVAKGVVCCHRRAEPPLPYPFVVKPLQGGSSVGLSFVHTAEDWKKLAPSDHFLGDCLCEEYLGGREFTVGVLRGKSLPVVEIRPRGGIYDYAHKYTVGASEELCPAPLDSRASAHLAALALRAFHALNLRDYARLDFRADAAGAPRFLEANTLPGMTETSLLPLAAAAAGISFGALCTEMAQLACQRKNWTAQG